MKKHAFLLASAVFALGCASNSYGQGEINNIFGRRVLPPGLPVIPGPWNPPLPPNQYHFPVFTPPHMDGNGWITNGSGNNNTPRRIVARGIPSPDGTKWYSNYHDIGGYVNSPVDAFPMYHHVQQQAQQQPAGQPAGQPNGQIGQPQIVQQPQQQNLGCQVIIYNNSDSDVPYSFAGGAGSIPAGYHQNFYNNNGGLDITVTDQNGGSGVISVPAGNQNAVCTIVDNDDGGLNWNFD